MSFGKILTIKHSGHDGPAEGLLRLRAKSWMEPLDGQDISAHFVTIAFELDGQMLVERVPINPSMYLMPPTLWLSGSLGMTLNFRL